MYQLVATFEASWTCASVSFAVRHLHRNRESSYLVEVLQKIHYPALNLVLGQAGAGGVASYRLEVYDGSDLLGLDEGARRAGN